MSFIKKHKNKEKLAYRLPSYSPLAILLRFSIISLFAVLTLLLIVFAVGDGDKIYDIPIFYYLVIIIAFNIAAEVQIILDNVLERFLPIPNKIRLRLIIQSTSAIIILALTHKVVMGIFDPADLNSQTRPGIYMGLIIGLLFIFIMAQALTIARFTEKWTASQKQISDMKREKLEMDYNSLQDQLNPHFLFNNLSVLKSLIIYDKDSAVTFTENFTDVYRYVLQSKNKRLVRFKDELSFIDSYIGLHKERLGKGLKVKFLIDKDSKEKRIAPLTLQLLVENAIKHNIASSESPLVLEIVANEDFVRIKNNVHVKETSYSTKTGLSNLLNRYELLSDKKIRIESNDVSFLVEVPFLLGSE
jgi:hypothetical protein